ncbi:MAG: class I adenylate-forming enzyme family protein [Ilumatobacteraceae bacterium]
MSVISRAEAIAALTAPGAAYELRVVDTAVGPQRVFVGLPQTLPDLYASCASDKEFLVLGDERRTFREVHELIAGLARVLVEEFEVGKGDRVAISMRNYPEWMITFAAASCIGAIAVGMNSLWQTDEMEYALRDAAPKVLVADAERLAQFDELPDLGISTISVRAPGRANEFHRMIDAFRLPDGSAPMPAVDVQPDDPVVILYTSGSTGHPKGVLSSHRAVLHTLYCWELDGAQVLARRPPSVTPHEPEPGESATLPPAGLLAIPLFHVMGLHGGFLGSWRAQRRTVLMTKWDPAAAAELIERERITSFSAPPAMTGDLVREAQRTDRDLSSLASVGGGGAARAPEQVRQIDATFDRAIPTIGWGMTETNAAGTYIMGAEYLANATSAGYPLAAVDLRVVDEDGVEVPDGTHGELQVRGTVMFIEYWNRPDAMAESITDDGWFRTGDVAYLRDGLLYIVDRIKDLIIRGGENIGCGQVEAALLAHPHVVEAAVYAVPDERLGEEVAATVHGTPELDLDELREFLLRHLARHEVPRYIFTADEPLPRTATGKVLKRDIRTAAAQRVTG